jgi:hypothetical protein
MGRLVIFLLLIVPLTGFTQAFDSTADIVHTKRYEKGIYKNFTEFKHNSPSVTEKFVFTGKNLWIPDQHGKNVKVKKKEVWGFSDGINVYIRRNKYSPLLLTGRYCYFIEKGTRIMFAYSVSPFAILPIPVPYRDKVILNFNTGTTYLLTKRLMKQILETDDPELLKKFAAERRKGKKLEEYLILYNKRNYHRIR